MEIPCLSGIFLDHRAPPGRVWSSPRRASSPSAKPTLGGHEEGQRGRCFRFWSQNIWRNVARSMRGKSHNFFWGGHARKIHHLFLYTTWMGLGWSRYYLYLHNLIMTNSFAYQKLTIVWKTLYTGNHRITVFNCWGITGNYTTVPMGFTMGWWFGYFMTWNGIGISKTCGLPKDASISRIGILEQIMFAHNFRVSIWSVYLVIVWYSL